MMLSRFIAIATVCALSVHSANAANDQYADIRSIAVISAVGGTIDMQRLGFGFDEYTFTPDWDLNAHLTRQAAAVLSKKFVVKDVDPKILALPDDVQLNDIRRQIVALQKREGVDAYVIVLTDYTQPPHSRGLVVHRDPGLFGGGKTFLGFYYVVYVIDASSGKVIDYGSAQNPASGNIFGHSPPVDTCENSIWADSVDKLSSEQKASLRTEFSVLASRSIAYTFASAGLIDKQQADAVTATFDTTGDKACRPGYR